VPSRPFTEVLECAGVRGLGLEVFLTDPEVSIETNHLVDCPIPMARKL
jgi:hypothetical protein